MSQAPSTTLQLLAPPMRLVTWLDKVIEAKQRKGETVPPEIICWMQRWNDIRSHVPVPCVDGLTGEEWREIGTLLPDMVIGFTGHRDRCTETAELDAIRRDYPGAVWIHGGAEGFDTQVHLYAGAHGFIPEVIRPEYDKYPKKVAPLKRNEVIVDRSDLIIACYDQRTDGGTNYTIGYAAERGRPVRYVTCLEMVA